MSITYRDQTYPGLQDYVEGQSDAARCCTMRRGAFLGLGIWSRLALPLIVVGLGLVQGVQDERQLTLARAAVPSNEPAPFVLFVENVGQFAENARFRVLGAGTTLWVGQDALWLIVHESLAGTVPDDPSARASRLLAQARGDRQRAGRAVAVRMTFPDAGSRLVAEPFNRLETKVSFFLGNDPSRWRSSVPVWGGVRIRGLRPGIDLEITGDKRSWKWSLTGPAIARQGAAAAGNLSLRIEGADGVEQVPEGLVVRTSIGTVPLPLPVMPWPISPKPTIVPMPDNSFLVRAPHVTRTQTSSPSSSSPMNGSDLVFSNVIGGSSWWDFGSAIAVDGSSNVYLAGSSNSSDYPTTPGAFDRTWNAGCNRFFCNPEVVVSKLNPDGASLAYSTFIGGTGENAASGISVDSTGAAYVTGRTSSPTYPTTPDAFQRSLLGGSDAFVTKLTPDGSALYYSTLLGGAASGETGQGIAIDAAGHAYVTGSTASADFPTTSGAFGKLFQGNGDIFITKLNASGSALLYSGVLGGAEHDWASAIAVDASGAAHVTGFTHSTDFPTTAGAFDRTFNGGSPVGFFPDLTDAFVAKVNPDGTALVYSTYLGGMDGDAGLGIAVDDNGSAYVAGSTQSANFPITRGTFQPQLRGGPYDGFVAKLEPSGTGLVYSTFLGGSNPDVARSIAVNAAGEAFVVGTTRSPDFPTTIGAYDVNQHGGNCWEYGRTLPCLDVFVAKLTGPGTALQYGTFIGGVSDDRGVAIATDALGAVYVSGDTASTDFPMTPTVDRMNTGGGGAIVVKLNPTPGRCLNPPPMPTPTATPVPTTTQTPGSFRLYLPVALRSACEP